MSESESSSQISQNSTDEDDDSADSDSDFYVADSFVNTAHEDDPIASDGEENINPEEMDEDGLQSEVLEARFEQRIAVNDWCKCGMCSSELLFNVREFRCCKEMQPAFNLMMFDGSIQRIRCITEHEEYCPMSHSVVLKHIGPMLKDKNGRSYRRKTRESNNDFLRAVAYRWLTRWLCGFWDGKMHDLSQPVYIIRYGLSLLSKIHMDSQHLLKENNH